MVLGAFPGLHKVDHNSHWSSRKTPDVFGLDANEKTVHLLWHPSTRIESFS